MPLARIQAHPESWNAVVAETSEEPSSKDQGGFMGDVTTAELHRRAAPEVEELLLKLKPGEKSDVVETRYGFHVFWRVD